MTRPSPSAATLQLVAEYLRRDPAFFDRHPELLRLLTLHHHPGKGITSLLERQIAALRLQNEELEHELRSLHRQAMDRQQLLGDLHAVALGCMRAAGPRELHRAMSLPVARLFGAAEMALFAFLDPGLARPEGHGGIRFQPRTSRVRDQFVSILGGGQPLVDSLQSENLDSLFGLGHGPVNASVLVPLKGRCWDGLLAVGSVEWDRFQQGPELEWLVYLGRTAAAVISGWLRQRS